MGIDVNVQPILADSQWATIIDIKSPSYRIKLLLDCGLSDSFNKTSLKLLLKHSSGIKYILLTHSTLAHVGGLPFVFKKYSNLGNRPQIICTEALYKIARSNLLDLLDNISINLPKHELYYTSDDIDSSLSNLRLLKYNEHISLDSENDVSLHIINSGHSVGGSAFIIKIGIKQILIARKISLVPEWHLNPLNFNGLNNLCLLITDLPKLTLNLPFFETSMAAIMHKTIKTLKAGNTVLIPTDIDSRLIELLHTFNHYWKSYSFAKWPIVIASPIAHKIALVFSTSIEYMSSKVKSEFSKDLKNPLIFENITYVFKLEQLNPFANVPCVIFSTPSSLNWGFSNALFAAIGSKKGNLIILSKEPSFKSLARKISLFTSISNGTKGLRLKNNGMGKEAKHKKNKFSWIYRFKRPLSTTACYEMYKNNQLEIESFSNSAIDSGIKIDDVNMENDDNITNNVTTNEKSQPCYHDLKHKYKSYSIISSDFLGHLKFNKIDTSNFPTFSDKPSNSVSVTDDIKNSIDDDYGLVNNFADLWKSNAQKTDDYNDDSVNDQQINKTDDADEIIDIPQKTDNTQSQENEQAVTEKPIDYYLKLINKPKFITKSDSLTLESVKKNESDVHNDWFNSLVNWFGEIPCEFFKKRIRHYIKAKVVLAIGLENTVDQFSLETLVSMLNVKRVCLLPIKDDKNISIGNKNVLGADKSMRFKYKFPLPIESLVECSVATESTNSRASNSSSHDYIFDKILDKCSREARMKFRLLNLKVKFSKINDGPEPKISFWQPRQPCIYSMDYSEDDHAEIVDNSSYSLCESQQYFPNIPIFQVAETFNELLPGRISVVGRHSAIIVASKTVIQRIDDRSSPCSIPSADFNVSKVDCIKNECNRIGCRKKWIVKGTIDPTFYLARKTLYALHGNPF